MKKIQNLSSYLLITFNILLIAIPLLVAVQWIFIKTKTTDVGDLINTFRLFERMIETPEGYVNLSEIDWTPGLKILGFSADILSLMPFILSLFVLKSIFKNYQKGEIFNVINAIHYRKLGWLFFLDALLVKSLSNTLMILTATLAKPGYRYINISFGTPNMESLFYGTLLIVISWIMLEASKLHDDQKFTI